MIVMILKIKKIFTLLMLSICLIIFTNNIFAISLNIDSFQVRTDSYNFYDNVQQGNYYDNVDLKMNFSIDQLLSNNNYLPVLLNSKIYGLLPNGQIVLIDVMPTMHHNIYSTNIEEYFSNNLFYLDPSFAAYMISLNINSLDNSYSDVDYAYIFSDYTIYENFYDEDYFEDFEDSENPNSNEDDDLPDDEFEDDFSLSGVQDFYLDEDEKEDYKLYLKNNSDEELQIISITTNEPTRLDVEDIDYSEFINSDSTATITLELLSDTVSSDYTGELEINVMARYLEQDDISKTYVSNYHIEDEDSQNTSDCSDLEIDNSRFTINDNFISNLEIILINESDDYYFELDEVNIESDSILETKVVNFTEEIDEESNGVINLEVISDDISNNTTRTIELEIEGYFKRENRDSEKCRISKNLRINVEDNSSNEDNSTSQTNCNNLILFTPSIIQEENTIKNYNKNKGFFVINNSNKEFTITNLIISDNTSKSTLSKNISSTKIYANSDLSLDFDLQTNEITNNLIYSKANVSISGTFSDGSICNALDTKQNFDLSIVSSEDKCSKIGLRSKIITTGNNTITLFNNSDLSFYVTDFLEANKFNLESNVNSVQHTIEKNKTKDVSVGFSGNGSLELKLNGVFSDGTNCSFSETRSGIFASTNISEIDFAANIDNCSFQLEVPSYLEIDDSYETINLNFKNLSVNGGKITLIGNGVVVNPSIIYLDGQDDFQKNIVISNFYEPESVFYNVKLNGCETKTDFTNLEEKIDVSKRIYFVSYPNLLKPSSKLVVVDLEINNSYNTKQNIKLKVSGFPSSWTIESKDVLLNERTSNTLNYSFYIDDLNNSKKYNGYIEIYKNNLKINSVPLTVDLTKPTKELIMKSSLSKLNSLENTYALELFINNKSNSSKEYVVDFNLDGNYVVEGNKEINLLADENKTIEYKIVTFALLKDSSVIDVIIKDKVSGEELESSELVYTLENNVGLTGFLVFNSLLTEIGLAIVLIIIIISIIIQIKKNKISKNKPKI